MPFVAAHPLFLYSVAVRAIEWSQQSAAGLRAGNMRLDPRFFGRLSLSSAIWQLEKRLALLIPLPHPLPP